MNGKTTKRLRKAFLKRNELIGISETDEDSRRIWRRMKKLYNKIPRNERSNFLKSLVIDGLNRIN